MSRDSVINALLRLGKAEQAAKDDIRQTYPIGSTIRVRCRKLADGNAEKKFVSAPITHYVEPIGGGVVIRPSAADLLLFPEWRRGRHGDLVGTVTIEWTDIAFDWEDESK